MTAVDVPVVADTENVSPEEQEVVDEMEEEVELNSVPILKMIKACQLEHGLRHRDYQRYRRYCTNRARRIRKFLNFRLGERRKVISRKVTEEEARSNSMYIILLIMSIEHDWSFAMELKESDQPRKRHHMRNKLRKASKKAHELLALLGNIADSCDARTALEAQAYCSYIIGNFLLEQQDWSTCYAKFKSTQTIYSSLSATLPADEADIYAEFSSELEPSLRYCQYNMGESGDTDNVADLLKGKGSSLIEGKLSDHLAKLKVQEAENLNVTEWRGKRIAIRNETVRVFLLNYREFLEHIDDMEVVEEKLDKYAEVMMDCGEAIELVKTELRIDPSHRAAMEKGQAPQSDLFIYLTNIKLEVTLSRYMIIASQATKFNELSRIFEQTVQYIAEFVKKCGEAGVSDLGDEMESEKMVYIAACRYYQSRQAQESRKYKEAGALILKSKSLLAAATPEKTGSKILKEKLTKLIQSNAASIQASILLPQGSTTTKESGLEKDALFKRLTEYGSKFGTIEFPPMLTPIPGKPTLFDIAGDKAFDFPSLDNKVEKKVDAPAGGITGRLGGWLGWGK